MVSRCRQRTSAGKNPIATQSGESLADPDPDAVKKRLAWRRAFEDELG